MRCDKNTEWVLTLEFKALPNHAELFKSMCFHSAQALENTNGITAIGVVELKTAEECRARESDCQKSIQQGAVADLPAADGGLAKIETALGVYKEYLLLYENTSFKPTFFGYCQQQLTALAGR